MTQPPDEDFAKLDALLTGTMAGILATLEIVLDPSGRLAAILGGAAPRPAHSQITD